MTFATSVPALFTSFVYCTNMYWSVIHGIKRKPHLSVAWNWYHFVAIAILHQPRPTDSADINTRLQLSDTSSIPPMHGGFLLIFRPARLCVAYYDMKSLSGPLSFPSREVDLMWYVVWCGCLLCGSIQIDNSVIYIRLYYDLTFWNRSFHSVPKFTNYWEQLDLELLLRHAAQWLTRFPMLEWRCAAFSRVSE